MNANSTNNIMQNIKSNKAAKLLLVAALAQLVVFILWFVPTLKLSVVSGYYYSSGGSAISDTQYSAATDSYAITKFFEGLFVLNLIFIVLMLLSLFFLIKPVLFNKLAKKNNFVLTKITSLVTLGLFLILFFVSKSETAKYADIGAICKLTFGGWLFIILNIAIFVLTIGISSNIKLNLIAAQNEASSNTSPQ